MLLNDIRFAVRVMRRAPLFSLTVIFTVAVAIIANTTIFSVVNTVLLKPLPFRNPDRLIQVAEKNDKLKLDVFSSSVLNFVSWREQSKSFEELAAMGFSNYTLSGAGEPEQFSGNTISPALVRVLGVPSEAEGGAEEPAVVSQLASHDNHYLTSCAFLPTSHHPLATGYPPPPGV